MFCGGIATLCLILMVWIPHPAWLLIILPALWLGICRSSSQAARRLDAEAEKPVLQLILDQLDEVFWITSPDCATIHYANPAFETLCECSRQTLYDDPALWPKKIVPEDRRRVITKFMREAPGSAFDEIFRIQRDDGSIRWIHGRGVPIVNDDGSVQKIAGILYDITEQKITQEDLAAQSALSQAIIDQLPFPVFLKDEDLRFCACNQQMAELFNSTPADLLNRTDLEMVPEELARIYQERDRRVLESGEPLHMEEQILVKGEMRTVLTHKMPIREKGRVTKVLGYIHDVTEENIREQVEREINAQLERSKRLESVGKLAGEVAHDLNNILGPVVAYPDLILQDLKAKTVKEDLLQIKQASLNAAAIIQDLLALSRRSNTAMNALDLNQVIHAALKSPAVRSRCIQEPEITFQVDAAEDLPAIMGAEANLGQVILNLVINACEAMYGQGQLHIATREITAEPGLNRLDPVEAGDYILLTVQDTGEGIPHEKIASIFEPFYSTKKSEKRKGTGLGLSIVYGIVKDHGGYIDVESTPGKGTTFKLYFPPSLKPIESDEPPPPRELRGKERILIVDDVKSQRALAERLLERLGYQVQTCANGREAVAWLRENTVDLVVLDMIMEPDYDGLDTYIDLRRIHPNLPCIIASGYSETERVHHARSLGISDYIRKPYLMETLGQSIRRVLNATPAPPDKATPDKAMMEVTVEETMAPQRKQPLTPNPNR